MYTIVTLYPLVLRPNCLTTATQLRSAIGKRSLMPNFDFNEGYCALDVIECYSHPVRGTCGLPVQWESLRASGTRSRKLQGRQKPAPIPPYLAEPSLLFSVSGERRRQTSPQPSWFGHTEGIFVPC